MDSKLQIIKQKLFQKPKITITYFLPDIKKDGGKYVTVTDNVKKIDEYKQVIILQDQTEIPISEIIDIALGWWLL